MVARLEQTWANSLATQVLLDCLTEPEEDGGNLGQSWGGSSAVLHTKSGVNIERGDT